MTHIRVERLAAGDRQCDSAQHDEADRRMGEEKVEGVREAECRHDLRKRTDLE